MAYSGIVPTFNYEEDDWSTFKVQLEQFFIVNDINVEKAANKRKAFLIGSLSKISFKLLENLIQPKVPSNEGTTYDELITVLESHFKPVVSYFAERNIFFQSAMEKSETVQQWAARVRALAANCKFGDHLNLALRDKFIFGLPKGPAKDKLFLEDVTTLQFQKAIEIAASVECISNQYRGGEQLNIKSESPTSNGVYRLKARNSGNRVQKKASDSKTQPNSKVNGKCKICGYTNHEESECRFRTYSCNKCKRKGHLAKMCTANKGDKVSNNSNIKNEVNYISDSINNELSLYFCSKDSGTNPIKLDVLMNGIPLVMELDSGASVSAISSSLYERLFSNCQLIKTDLILKSYSGNAIIPIGKIQVNIKYNNKSELLEIFVINGGGPPILGRNWMKIFKVKFEGLNLIKGVDKNVEQIVSKYPEVFDDQIGRFKNHKVSLKLKENTTPKFFRPRRLPFAIKDKVEKEILKLVDLKILEPVNYSEWGTPIVPILKKNGEVRICGDYKVTLNSQLCVDKYCLPKIDELFTKLHGGVEFSKIDLAMAYQQIELDDNSKDLTTISTTKGLFKYTRLVYGLAPAPAIFQRIIENLLANIDGVVVFMDDVLVTAKNREQHVTRLETVIKRLHKVGFKVSKEKCEFFAKSINYLGHTIDKDGLHMDKRRVQAILDLRSPNSVKELQSFLGIVNFYRNFMPNLATKASTLYDLLSKDRNFEWAQEHNDCFENIKRMLVSNQVLAHYNPDIPIKLVVDASPTGVAAVLLNVYDSGVERPITFASQRLSATEMKYAQVEKEALAIMFGVKKFHQYLYGRPFILVSDNKPLVSIFGSKRGIPPMSANRLQRYALFLSGYQFNIEYVNTKKNIADYLSRSPLDPGMEDREHLETADAYINYVKEMQNTLPITLDHVRLQIEKDENLVKVRQYIIDGWPDKIDENILKPYFIRKDELSVESDCILWGLRLIIPEGLRKTVLSEIHKTHLGIVKMKGLARSYVWWPSLDKDLETIVKLCGQCLHYRNTPGKAPLINWDWPEEPWERIHMDFMGPVFKRQFLIISDAHSKWLECINMGTNISSSHTIEKIRPIFSRFGLPKVVVTDNGRTFISVEFENFLKMNGIRHATIPVGHPATNGQAENGVKICKLALKKALHSQSTLASLDQKLESFLLDYRNSIHGTTGVSPAELMFGRKIRSRFDIINPFKKNSSLDTKENNKFKLKKKVDEMQEKQQKYYKNSKRKTLGIGSFVMAKDYSIPGKISWKKCKVIKKLGKRYWKIKVIGKLKLFWKRHINQLISCLDFNEQNKYIPSSLTDPLEKLKTLEDNREHVITETESNTENKELIFQKNESDVTNKNTKSKKQRIDYKKLQIKDRYPKRNN